MPNQGPKRKCLLVGKPRLSLTCVTRLCVHLALCSTWVRSLSTQVRFVEIDHPSTSVAKARGIEKVGQPENMVQIAADLGERSLPKVLSKDGHWDASQRSVIVAEGLFQYLTDEEVRGLLTDAAACTSPGSRIAFSHAIPGDRKHLSTHMGLISEPWKSEVRSEDLPSYVDGTGWEMISDVDDDAEHGIERYGVAERA